MSSRELQVMAVLLGWASFAGCSGDATTKDQSDTDGPTAGDDDDDDDGSKHSAGGSAYFDAATVTFESQFVYDSANFMLVPLHDATYGDLPGTIDIYLGTSTWNGDTSQYSSYCVISLIIDNPAIPDWVTSDTTLWYGAEYSGSGGATSCNQPGFELDPEVWGKDPVAAMTEVKTGAPQWGTAIGELSQDASDWLLPQLTTDEQPYWFGGKLMSPLLGGSDDGLYTMAVQVDPTTFEAQDDGTNYLVLDQAAVYSGSVIATAWYRSFESHIWGLK